MICIFLPKVIRFSVFFETNTVDLRGKTHTKIQTVFSERKYKSKRFRVYKASVFRVSLKSVRLKIKKSVRF